MENKNEETRRKVFNHDSLKATESRLKEKRNLRIGSAVLLSLMLRRIERNNYHKKI